MAEDEEEEDDSDEEDEDADGDDDEEDLEVCERDFSLAFTRLFLLTYFLIGGEP